MFSSKAGSIGFLVFNDYEKTMAPTINKVQLSFKWSFAIFFDAPRVSFQNAQIDTPAGALKILQSASLSDTVELMLRIVSYLSDEKRMEQQVAFFAREEASLLNRSTSKSILASMLRDEVGVRDERDLTSLANAYSFKTLLHATITDFEDMLMRGDLVEPSTVDRLRVFIQNINGDENYVAD